MSVEWNTVKMTKMKYAWFPVTLSFWETQSNRESRMFHFSHFELYSLIIVYPYGIVLDAFVENGISEGRTNQLDFFCDSEFHTYSIIRSSDRFICLKIYIYISLKIGQINKTTLLWLWVSHVCNHQMLHKHIKHYTARIDYNQDLFIYLYMYICMYIFVY